MWEMEQTSKKPLKNTDQMLNHAAGTPKEMTMGRK